ncbi:hypothetical protein TVAG_151810 [Trichomonas vaginalis G3]|uniref:Uncharacterized protein n=1 Tax=Trichomonas vaginalis (strain ATCC PRA-98 / G3) TaxID=412133 RepID=A2ELU6_TRIV3|nr:hypothetical protein TVAGG3_0400960 [Trichomonas vaginalis G3]EAY06374.1 hypothetical protein TVAG_151810 [Trichomonas vaginalis G3]KAI5534686.1 hypothetical protein TVAGG3_0400960 [Trichomonas vaginalis G3]|eukprot:XP_001318597.1 hypothetical protein [Trichomonas vaginalis G3]
MFLLFSFLVSADNEADSFMRRNEGTTKFSILSVQPSPVNGNGDQIQIQVNKNISSLVFCRFNNRDFRGKKLEDYLIQCDSPKLREKEVRLFVSEDRLKWTAPYILVIDPLPANKDGFIMLLIVLLVVVILLMSLKSIMFPKKKKAHKKKKKLHNKNVGNQAVHRNNYKPLPDQVL